MSDFADWRKRWGSGSGAALLVCLLLYSPLAGGGLPWPDILDRPTDDSLLEKIATLEEENCLVVAEFSEEFAEEKGLKTLSVVPSQNSKTLRRLRPLLTSENLLAGGLKRVLCLHQEKKRVKGIVYLPPVGERPLGGSVIQIYKPNFGLVAAWDDLPHQDKVVSNEGLVEEEERAQPEIKFQFSFKADLIPDPLHPYVPLFFGYTQKSYWQAYDTMRSRPFRENNFNPELFLDYFSDEKVTSGRLGVVLGLVEHESNGQIELFSRSWNRSYLQPYFVSGRVFASFKIWNRWNEDPEKDDNPDLEEFLGVMEVRANFLLSERFRLNTFFRPSRHSRKYATFQLDFLFNWLLGPGVFWQLQHFNGYGESLIDYDQRVKRLGFGILFR